MQRILKPIVDNDEVKHYMVLTSEGPNHHFFFDKKTGVSVREGLTVGDARVAQSKIFTKSGAVNPNILEVVRLVRKQADIKLDPDPFWSPVGPELLDICITDRCNRGCSYCYQAAKPEGTDMPLDLYEEILMQSGKTVAQVALGGGEVTIHPQFLEILRITREKYGIVPNYTTNGDAISEDILSASRRLCGAIAISAHGTRDEWLPKAKRFAEAGCKTNIHFILGEETAEEAIGILKEEPLKGINAIIFLMYKPIGRATEKGVLKTKEKIDRFIEALNKTKLRVGFDACSMPMIVSKTKFSTVPLDTCEGSRFSGYVHVNGEVKPCSFDKRAYPNIRDASFPNIWAGKEFQAFRDHLAGCKCDCSKKPDCMGGCPIYKEISICDLPGRK